MQIQINGQVKILEQLPTNGKTTNEPLNLWQATTIKLGSIEYLMLCEAKTGLPILIRTAGLKLKNLKREIEERIFELVPSNYAKQQFGEQILSSITQVKRAVVLFSVQKLKQQFESNQALHSLLVQIKHLPAKFLDQALQRFVWEEFAADQVDDFYIAYCAEFPIRVVLGHTAPGYQRPFALPQIWELFEHHSAAKHQKVVAEIKINNQVMIASWLNQRKFDSDQADEIRQYLDLYLNQNLLVGEIELVTTNPIECVCFVDQILQSLTNDQDVDREQIINTLPWIFTDFFSYLAQTGVIRRKDYKIIKGDLDCLKQTYLTLLTPTDLATTDFPDPDEVLANVSKTTGLSAKGPAYTPDQLAILVQLILSDPAIYQRLRAVVQIGVPVKEILEQIKFDDLLVDEDDE